MSFRQRGGDGKSPETAGWISEFSLPTFMVVGGGYHVVIGPIFRKGVSLFRREVSLYTIRSIGDGGQNFSVETPIKLPRKFLVTKKVRWCEWYRYLPINAKGRTEEESYFHAFKGKARILTTA